MADKDDNTIYIGHKDPMAYVLAVTTQANIQTKIKIKARGRAIGMAVDVSQIALNRHLKGWKMGNIAVGTEERPFTPKDPKQKVEPGQTLRVSFIELELVKG